MKIKYLSILAIFLGLFSLTATADNEQKLISVQGSASVAAVPDAFSVTFLIEEQGETVSKLNERVTESTRSIIKFLRKMKVDERNIETMQIQLNPYYESYQRERVQKGFVLRRTIKVSHTQLDQYDALIDGVLKNGANRIEQFNFVVLNQQKLYRQALSAAMLDAKQKALQLLEPLDAELGALYSVSEQQGYSQPRSRMMMADTESSTALPGVQGINATVSVRFLIK